MSNATVLRLVPPGPPHDSPELLLQQAKDSFLADYTGATLRNYTYDLQLFLTWCTDQQVPPLEATRPDLKAYLHFLQNPDRHDGKGWSDSTVQRRLSSVRMFYRNAVIEEFAAKDPTVAMRTPSVDYGAQKRTYLEPLPAARWLGAAREHSDTALLLGLLMLSCGFRISEALAVDIEHFTVVKGWDVVTIRGKGRKTAQPPIPVPVMRLVRDVIGDRTTGPLLVNQWGNRMTQSNARHLVKKIAAAAGVTTDVSPHTFRRIFVTTALQLGIPVHKVQQAARHAHLETTLIYNRQQALDDHASHNVASFYSQFTD